MTPSVATMDRTDSAFDETFRMPPAKKTPRKAKPAPAREGHGNTPPSTSRPASARPHATPQRGTESRRKSITTNSSHSTKSRRRGHGSVPSSRRTSCTIIDPSRPTRHYRINSAQTCPTLARDIDDVLALHFRSCTLFQSTRPSSSLPRPTLSAHGPSVAADMGATSPPRPQATVDASGGLVVLDEKAAPTADTRQDTVMHWMLPSTRKRQYDRIDRANRGFLGFVRRLLPPCVSAPDSLPFYEEEKSDAGSVRRYRMDLSGDDDDDDDDEDPGTASGLKQQRRRLERSREGCREKRVLGCF